MTAEDPRLVRIRHHFCAVEQARADALHPLFTDDPTVYIGAKRSSRSHLLRRLESAWAAGLTVSTVLHDWEQRGDTLRLWVTQTLRRQARIARVTDGDLRLHFEGSRVDTVWIYGVAPTASSTGIIPGSVRPTSVQSTPSREA